MRSAGRPARWPAGLTGYRYLLAVAVLVALAIVPTLVAAAVGTAALDRSAAPATGATPFVSYPAATPDRSAVDLGVVRPDMRRSRVHSSLIDPLGGDMGDPGWCRPR